MTDVGTEPQAQGHPASRLATNDGDPSVPAPFLDDAEHGRCPMCGSVNVRTPEGRVREAMKVGK